MHDLRVELGERSYPIHIGAGLIGRAELFAPHLGGKSVALVTNTTVDPLYGAKVEALLKSLGKKVIKVVLPDGEAYKNWETLNLIFDAMLSGGADRKTAVVALGGGVVGDMAGFAAASFMRGVPFIQVPTTLLSQVDSSVGGKTGINHPLGKNMIGSFYQPLAVIADTDTLKTLPPRELAAGLAEVIKHGAIADAEFFAWVEDNIGALNACDTQALSHAVKRSCEIKAGVVAQDERETGSRATLNFGHTFGHTIEAGMGYGEWLHGEAVGCGMVMGGDLSRRMGWISAGDLARIRKLVAAAHLPVVAPDLGRELWLALMRGDKKSEGGEIRFVLLSKLGRAVMATAPQDALDATLADGVRAAPVEA